MTIQGFRITTHTERGSRALANEAPTLERVSDQKIPALRQLDAALWKTSLEGGVLELRFRKAALAGLAVLQLTTPGKLRRKLSRNERQVLAPFHHQMNRQGAKLKRDYDVEVLR